MLTPAGLDETLPELRADMGETNLADPDFQMGNGCLIDQLVGQFMAHVCGLGYLLDRGKVEAVGQFERMRQLPGVVEEIPQVDSEPLLVVRHPAVHKDVRPERYIFRRVHRQIFIRRVRQRHVGRRDAVEEEKGIVALGSEIVEDALDFVLHAEPVHDLRPAAILDKLLARVAVIHRRMQRIVEAEKFGRGMNMPLADQSRVVAGGFELLGDCGVRNVEAHSQRPRGNDRLALFAVLADIAESAHACAGVLPRNWKTGNFPFI